MNSPERDSNEPTAKSVLTITMLHPQDLDPAAMSDVDVANHLSLGSFVGHRTSLETVAIADDKVSAELEAIGFTPDHFAAKGPFVEPGNDD